MKRMTELTESMEGRVIDITAEPLIRERLLELGLAPGQSVRIVRIMAFSGPLIVQVGPLFLAMRHDEANQVWIE